MRRFIERALAKTGRMETEQIKSLLYSIATENERLEAVLDSMNDGILVCDSGHSLVLCNKASERLLPLLGQDILEKPLWSVIDDEEISAFVRTSLEEDDRVSDKEFTIGAKGSIKVLSLSIIPLVRDRRVQGNLVHVTDITEKRAKETRLRRAENLASLTTLAAGVAHEIKNPLGSIGIRMQLIGKALAPIKGSGKATIERHLAVVKEEIERLNRIVVDFLFAVRPMDISLESTSLNRVVAETCEFMRYELEAAGITLSLDLDSALPDVLADPRFLKQAVLNLVKNAREAMPDGGALSVSTVRKEGEATLSVADTGVGIPEENLAKIFEPYFTTRDSGSGLGLTLVFKIVKEHGGEISVRSRPGEGATFAISLPLPQHERRLIPQDSQESPGGNA